MQTKFAQDTCHFWNVNANADLQLQKLTYKIINVVLG